MFEERVHRFVFGALFALAFLASSAAPANAQPAELRQRRERITWSSGAHDGPVDATAEPLLVASQVISSTAAPWIQLEFGGAYLGLRSRVEVTSLLDGVTQTLDAESFAQWSPRSAYFNGDAVEIRLFAGPEDQGVELEVSSVFAGEWGAPSTKSICGNIDDRVASSDPRVARIDPVGCTGWVVENGALLTAGHCINSAPLTVISFNVPPSLSDGTIQFPGIEYQYVMNPSSTQFGDGGPGNDWAVFSVHNNLMTGLQPVNAQGGFRIRQDLNPANMRITGHGSDNGTANQTNQTHVGPNAGSFATLLSYNTDTQDGNSGSPVIDEATGEAIGIHGHGGCTSTGGANHGTSFFNGALWTAADFTFPKSCPDLVPVLAGDSSAVSTSGTFGSSYSAWRAFDAPSGGSMWISEAFEHPAWIAYDFGSNQVVNRYKITPGLLASSAPRYFMLQGWNGFGWMTIDTRINQTNWVGGLPRTYEVAYPGNYSRYRLYIMDDNDLWPGVFFVSLQDLSFERCGCPAASDRVPALTGPSSALTTSGIFDLNYPAWHAFDAGNSMWISETWETPAWLAYNWGASPRLITQYNLTNTNGALTTRAPMNFRLQGWNGSSWVTVDTRTGETGWISHVPRSYTVATPGLFRQYRLHITDDNDVRPGVVTISLGNAELMGCR